MNEKLIVKNFGPIKYAELDLKKVTIFIGPQGSGKSALAKLVAICKDSDFLATAHIGIKPTRFFEKYDVQYFSEECSFSYNNSDYEFYFRKDPYLFEIEAKKSKPRHFFVGGNPNFPDFESYKGVSHVTDTDLIPLKKYLSSVAKNYVKYIPTDRLMLSSVSDSLLSLLSADVALTKGFIDFGRDFEIARSKLSSLKIDFLGIRYIYEKNRNYVTHLASGANLPLSASSSGQQSVIPLYIVVEHFTKKLNVTTIVEEPELNLYPNAQKELVSYLVSKGIQGENELLIATHSPYILSAINNLIFAYKVAHEVPEKSEEVAQIIPREQWLNPDDVVAYYVADGTVKSIIDEGEGLIGENELDAISEDISGERDQLFKILRSKKRETVH